MEKKLLKFENVWMAFAVTAIIVLSIIAKSSILQIIASVTGVIYVIGVASENRIGIILGTINTVIYGYLMFKEGLIGASLYNMLYCTPMLIYTFFSWGKARKDSNKKQVVITKYSNGKRAIMVLSIILLILIYILIGNCLHLNSVIIDAITIIVGFFGMYCMAKKNIEQWYCWLVVNFTNGLFWGIKCITDMSNIAMVLMWIIYFSNNLYGLYKWSKKYNEQVKIKSAT